MTQMSAHFCGQTSYVDKKKKLKKKKHMIWQMDLKYNPPRDNNLDFIRVLDTEPHCKIDTTWGWRCSRFSYRYIFKIRTIFRSFPFLIHIIFSTHLRLPMIYHKPPSFSTFSFYLSPILRPPSLLPSFSRQ